MIRTLCLSLVWNRYLEQLLIIMNNTYTDVFQYNTLVLINKFCLVKYILKIYMYSYL